MQADQADHRRLGGQVLQLLHVGVERELVDPRLDVAEQLALRRLAGAVEPLQRGLEFGRNRHHRPHRAPGDHLERADRVAVGRVRHRQRDLGFVLAQRQRPHFAQEARAHAFVEDRKLRIAGRVDQRQLELRGERFGDVALRDHAQRDQQRTEPLARLLLHAQVRAQAFPRRACRARSGSRQGVFWQRRPRVEGFEIIEKIDSSS